MAGETAAAGGGEPLVTVVVMAYNEVASLEPVVREIESALVRFAGPYEVLIVDDGSTDGTGAAADALAVSLTSVRVVHHSPNLGLGGVYRTGFREARGKYLTFFPADGQFPATIIEAFVDRMSGADLVLGYLPGRRGSVVARALSLGERVLYRALFGPMPKFQGVLMLRRTLLEEFSLRSAGRGWAIVMELILRAERGGARIVSVPTTVRPRMSGSSKVNNWRTIRANFGQMVGLTKWVGRRGLRERGG